MIDLNSFTFYELETLRDLIDGSISLNYKMKDRHPSLYINKDKETDELMLLKVKIVQHMATLEKPSNIQRFKDGKKIK